MKEWQVTGRALWGRLQVVRGGWADASRHAGVEQRLGTSGAGRAGPIRAPKIGARPTARSSAPLWLEDSAWLWLRSQPLDTGSSIIVIRVVASMPTIVIMLPSKSSISECMKHSLLHDRS